MSRQRRGSSGDGLERGMPSFPRSPGMAGRTAAAVPPKLRLDGSGVHGKPRSGVHRRSGKASRDACCGYCVAVVADPASRGLQRSAGCIFAVLLMCVALIGLAGPLFLELTAHRRMEQRERAASGQGPDAPPLASAEPSSSPLLDATLCDKPLTELAPKDAPGSTCSRTGRRIAGFFHVGVGSAAQPRWWTPGWMTTPRYLWPRVANELAERIVHSGLADCVEAVHVAAVGSGDGWEKRHPPIFDTHPKFHVDHVDDSMHNFEFPTLKMLHDYCLAQPDALVFYIHTKGSYNLLRLNEVWRYLMTHYVIDNAAACIEQLEVYGKTACGFRWLEDYYPIMIGNFWWARCDYVSKLKCPLPQPETAGTYGHGLPNNPTGRYLAETWIGSARGLSHPTDCAPPDVCNCTRCEWEFNFPEPVSEQPVMCGRDANALMVDEREWVR